MAVRYQPEMASLTPPMNATPGSSRTMTDVTVSDASAYGCNTATVAATATGRGWTACKRYWLTLRPATLTNGRGACWL
jgi:hypothetical protein